MKRITFFVITLFSFFYIVTQLKATDTLSLLWQKRFIVYIINNIDISKDGQYLAIGCQTNSGMDASAMIIRASDGTKLKSYYDFTNSCQAKFSPTGKYLMLAGQGFTIYNFETGDTVIKVTYNQSTDIAMSPDETKFIVSKPGYLEFWDLETKTKTDSIAFIKTDDPKIPFIYCHLRSLTYSPDGKYIGVISIEDSSLIVLNANTNIKSFSYPVSTDSKYCRVKFSPDSKYFCIGEDIILMVNIENFYDQKYISGNGRISDFVFTKDGNKLLYGGNNFLNLYDLKNSTNTYLDPTHSTTWQLLSLSNSNDTLYTAISDVLVAFDLRNFMSVENINQTNNISISINNLQDILNVFTNIESGKEISIRIFNLEGQLVKILFSGLSSLDNYSGSFNISDLASGAYILNIQGSGINTSANFIIAR